MSREWKTLSIALSSNSPDDEEAGLSRYKYRPFDIIDNEAVEEYLHDPHIIDMQDLFNNLDGEDRARDTLMSSHVSGWVVVVGSLMAISNIIDTPELIPHHLSGFIDKLDKHNIYDVLDNAMDDLQRRGPAEHNISSFLFGRYIAEDLIDQHSNDAYIRDEMYRASINALWEMINTIANDIDNVELIYQIYYYLTNDAGYDPDFKFDVLAEWRGEIMHVVFKIKSRHDLMDKLPVSFFAQNQINRRDYER